MQGQMEYLQKLILTSEGFTFLGGVKTTQTGSEGNVII